MFGRGVDNRDEASIRVANELRQIYRTKLFPLEKEYAYHYFYTAPIADAEFSARPQILMCGQYSVGKTSFIKYLLGRDFPGQHIGPEPTTDRFIGVMHGPEERVIPGNAVSVAENLPFQGLDRFGVGFLNRFQVSQCPSPVLENISIMDTPGVLSGEKQRVARGYDFVQVCSWFAEKSDLILLLFDAHKLDISDEFKSVILSMKGQEEKIRVILNKADSVDRQRLMRVYGALMWSLGKVLQTPEVLRVFVGSFWDAPLQFEDNQDLFEMEEADLMNDLRELPRNAVLRKINELVKRARLVKVHAFIIGYLRAQMPFLAGKKKKQNQLIADLPNVFRTVMKMYNLSPGDFPNLDIFRDKLKELNFSDFPKLKQERIEEIDNILAHSIPRLMNMLPTNYSNPFTEGAGADEKVDDEDVKFEDNESSNPFGDTSNVNNPFNASETNEEWPVLADKTRYDEIFKGADPVDGKLDPSKASTALLTTGLELEKLKIIWDLVDIDGDGNLGHEEFALAMYLCEATKTGEPIPNELPQELIPPSRR